MSLPNIDRATYQTKRLILGAHYSYFFPYGLGYWTTGCWNGERTMLHWANKKTKCANCGKKGDGSIISFHIAQRVFRSIEPMQYAVVMTHRQTIELLSTLRAANMVKPFSRKVSFKYVQPSGRHVPVFEVTTSSIFEDKELSYPDDFMDYIVKMMQGAAKLDACMSAILRLG